MRNSLQDQLVQAGLADAKQAKKAKAAKPPKRRKRRGAAPETVDEGTRLAREAQADKAARDRALNRERQAQAERKARASQIRDLITRNRLPREDAELGFNFVDGGKVRKIHVTDAMRRQLGAGQLGITRMDGRYEVVPADIAGKIRARDARCVVDLPAEEPETPEDDPYAAYKVPDDLMW
jgi:uncharacterized protein YaiL (DUF2058 family)